MKYVTLIIFLSLFTNIQSVSQDLEGLYTSDKGDSLWFHANNEILFRLAKDDCLGGIDIFGNGSYKRKNNRIIIQSVGHPQQYESVVFKTELKSNNALPNIKSFIIKDADNNPIEGASVFFQPNPKKYNGVVTDAKGRAELKIDEAINSDIRIEYLGYIPAKISKVKDNAVYIVVFKKGSMIFADRARISIMFSIIDGHNIEIRNIKYKKDERKYATGSNKRYVQLSSASSVRLNRPSVGLSRFCILPPLGDNCKTASGLIARGLSHWYIKDWKIKFKDRT